MRSPFVVAATLLATTATACLEFSMTLQESFVGTNDLIYTLTDNGGTMCDDSLQTSGDFGQSKFHVDCPSGWNFDVDMDDGQWGHITIHSADGREFSLPLDQNGPDHQFGCGNELCIGVQEDRVAKAYC